MIHLLSVNIKDEFESILKSTNEKIRIISPFLGYKTALKLSEISNSGIEVTVITKFSRADFYFGASSLEGLLELAKSNVELLALKKLHTKLYIFDNNKIILGSSNFTTGGLETNIELNILIENEFDIINSAIEYFSEIKTSISKEYIISQERIMAEIEIIGDKKNTTYQSNFDFGQELSAKKKIDLIEQSFNEINVSNETSAWIKFEGDSSGLEAVKVNVENGMYKPLFPTKPTGIKTGDIVFIARHSYDINKIKMPIVYGYGIAKAFTENNVGDEHPRGHIYYINIEGFKFIKCKLNEGITYSQIYEDIGNKFYPNYEPIKNYKDFCQRYHRRSHMKISDTGKIYLLNQLNKIIT